MRAVEGLVEDDNRHGPPPMTLQPDLAELKVINEHNSSYALWKPCETRLNALFAG